MNIQSIDVEPVIAPAGKRQQPMSKEDLLVESALDFLSDEPAKPVRGKAPAPLKKGDQDSDPEADGDGEESPSGSRRGPGEEGGEDGASDADDEAAEHERGDEESPEAEHDTRGSKEDPFTVKDLPKDKFIELKIDGEKVVVSMDELGASYIREKTFSQRINRTKQLADEAQRAVTEAAAFPQKFRDEFRSFVTDAEQLFDFFMVSDEREAILDQVARRYAETVRHFRERPHDRLAFQRQRDQDRLARERAAFEEQKQAEQTARQQKEAQERAVAIFKPGWEAGLRKAGFPKPTQALYDEVMVRANHRAAQGSIVTSDDITEWVVRAAKLLELPKGNEKKPAPAPVMPVRERPKKRGAYDDVPKHKRRQDPDYFLRSLKSSDFRLR